MMTTWNDVLAWAAKSTRPNGDCQGFAGNDFIGKFGKWRQSYYSAYTALAASKKAGTFHTGEPPADQVVWVWYEFPKYGHVMLAYNGIALGDTSFATTFLNKRQTIGTLPIHSYPHKYLGYSTTNGVNTIPLISNAPVKHVLTAAEVKRVATYLNSRKLGKSTTASVTGINIQSGSKSSNYYWEIQKAGNKDGRYPAPYKIDGIPGPKTYELEIHYRDLTDFKPSPAPVVVKPENLPNPKPVKRLTPAQTAELVKFVETLINS